MRSIMIDTVELLAVVPERSNCRADETAGGRSNTGQTSQTKRVSGEI
jgi:hypothetical protein